MTSRKVERGLPINEFFSCVCSGIFPNLGTNVQAKDPRPKGHVVAAQPDNAQLPGGCGMSYRDICSSYNPSWASFDQLVYSGDEVQQTLADSGPKR